MNILGIGPGPFIIFFLALMLFGPKQMVQFAYQAGKYLAQFRAMWEQTMEAVNKEFQEAGLNIPTDLGTKRFDIGAEAMKVINGTPEAKVPEMPPAASIPTPPIVGEPAAPISDSQPSLNNPSDDDIPKKYDSWLPN